MMIAAARVAGGGGECDCEQINNDIQQLSATTNTILSTFLSKIEFQNKINNLFTVENTNLIINHE